MTQPTAALMTPAEADGLFDELFGDGMPGPGRSTKPPNMVLDVRPLEVADLAALAAHIESGQTLGVTPSEIKRIRPTHHRLARLLAMGLDESKAGLLCNYTPARVAVLKSDPAFQELMAAYGATVEESWADTVEIMSGLSQDALQELQARLDENPELFKVEQLMDLAKLTLDRSGNGPSSTTNVNQRTIHMTASDLERIKNGSTGASNSIGQGRNAPRPLTTDDRRAIASQVGDAATVSGQVQTDQLSFDFGDAVREAGPEAPPDA